MTTGAKTPLKKSGLDNAVSKFIALIPRRLNCQMLMNFSRIEF